VAINDKQVTGAILSIPQKDRKKGSGSSSTASSNATDSGNAGFYGTAVLAELFAGASFRKGEWLIHFLSDEVPLRIGLG
jgi:hypothetical protein